MRESKTVKTISYVVIAALTLICLLPMIMVFINSFKNHIEIVENPLAIRFTEGIKNYVKAWKSGNFARSIVNSIVYTGSAVLITLLTATPCAYVIAGRKVAGTSVVLGYFMVAMTMPVYLFLVPLYRAYAGMGWLGNHVMVAFIQAATSLPLAITLLRTYYVGIPRELEEAARIDGSGTLQVIRYIILPLIKPGLITVGIITGLNTWNEFLVASTFLTGEENFTAMLALMALNGPNYSNQGVNMAATVIMVAPIIVFFILMQRQFIEGMVSGAVKG